MKKFIAILVLSLLWCNYSIAGTYFFKNCDDQASNTRATVTVDLDNKKAHIYSTDTSTGEVMFDGTARISKISEHKIVTEKTPWLTLKSITAKYNKYDKLLIETVSQIETYYPKTKKIITTMIVPNVHDKKKRKKLKKMGIPSFPWERTTTSHCQSVESEGIAVQKPKKKKEKTKTTTTKNWDPVKLYGGVTWWDRTVWFFEDLFSFESEKDAKIKQLEKRITQLERKSNKSQSVVDELLNLQMLIETIGD